MSRVLVLIAEGFEEIEAVTVIDVLRRADIDVVVAGLENREPITGSHGLRLVPEIGVPQLEGEWDLVVLPGGMGGTEKLAKDSAVLAMLRSRAEKQLPVAAICAAPLVLDRAGVLPEGGFTCYPGVESQMKTAGRRHERIVDVGTIVTSQGPGTAMEFTLHLVERLKGVAVSREVARGLLHESSEI